MVHWNELSDFLKSNPFQTYAVKLLAIEAPKRKDVEHFPILVDTPLVVEPEPVPVPVTKKPLAAVASTAVIRSKQPEIQKYTLDPIVFGIEDRDILYNHSPKASRRQMEINEALRCEALIDELYKSQGGRSRGWTKVMLEAAIRPRGASGGDLHELKQAKSVFLWQMVSDDKAISGFLDFLCVAKQIQVAIWNDERQVITVYPAAEYVGDGAIKQYPLYNVSSTGMMMKSNIVRNGTDLVKFANENSWTLLPPQSVLHTLEKLTLVDLESVGKKLGMAEVVGTKVERIAAVAGYKLKSRLSGGGAAAV
jgi:hypothetical protein